MKAFLDAHAGAAEPGELGGEGQAMDVEERQNIDHNIGLGEAPAVPQGQQTGCNIAMRVDNPLRPTGGAGAVDHEAGVCRGQVGLMELSRRRTREGYIGHHGL